MKRFKADAKTCVEAIQAAGGKVSLAHPYQMGLPDDELEALVKRMKGWGLDAIECYYPKYSRSQQEFYLHLAEKYRLHQTGGSDFHGEQVKPDRNGPAARPLSYTEIPILSDTAGKS